LLSGTCQVKKIIINPQSFIDFFPSYLNLGLAYLDKGDIWSALSNLKESIKGGSEIKEYIAKYGYRLLLIIV